MAIALTLRNVHICTVLIGPQSQFRPMDPIILHLLQGYLPLVFILYPVVLLAFHVASSSELRLCFGYMMNLLESLTKDRRLLARARRLWQYWRWLLRKSFSFWLVGSILGFPVVVVVAICTCFVVIFAGLTFAIVDRATGMLGQDWLLRNFHALHLSSTFCVSAFIGGWLSRKFILREVEREIEELERGVNDLAASMNRASGGCALGREWFQETDGRWGYHSPKKGINLRWPIAPKFVAVKSSPPAGESDGSDHRSSPNWNLNGLTKEEMTEYLKARWEALESERTRQRLRIEKNDMG